jgi:pyruvate formate lyase activating enzyme
MAKQTDCITEADDGFLVTSIQRYSINDGPGIRTTVFLKGCPLRCSWCHNPEAINPYQEFYHNTDKCVRCGDCVKICPENAITPPREQKISRKKNLAEYRMAVENDADASYETEIDPPKIDRKRCTRCMACVNVCRYDALNPVSQLMTIDEIYREVKSDEVFYQHSGGGMTLSGGEPLIHLDATLPLLKRARADGLNTCLDTTGYAPWENIEQVLDDVDLFLYDIKVMDDEKHRKWTGVSNRLILENARRLVKAGAKIRIRSVIIHDVNYWDLNHARNILAFAKELGAGVDGIDILPYHNFAESKYTRLGRDNYFKGFSNINKEDIADYDAIIASDGTWKPTVGGMIGVAKPKVMPPDFKENMFCTYRNESQYQADARRVTHVNG